MLRKLATKLRYLYQKHKMRCAIKRKLKNAKISNKGLDQKFINEVVDYWEKNFSIEPDINTFKYLTNLTGNFDVRYISEDIYVNYILPKTNPYNRCNGLNDKNVFPLLFPDRTPETFFANVNGILLDSEYNIISESTALLLLTDEEKVVIKPTTNTSQGKNVLCVKKSDILFNMKLMKKDYTVQKVIEQHDLLSRLNSSSVNVIRLTTYLNKKGVKILDSIVRIGSAGNFTDHLNLAVGIDNNGFLKDFGVTVEGEKVYFLPDGQEIKGIKIPAYKEMCSIAIAMHCRIAQALIIGWDFTVDKEGNPVIIEANLDFPGILRSQECNGPLFGEETDEILKEILFN